LSRRLSRRCFHRCRRSNHPSRPNRLSFRPSCHRNFRRNRRRFDRRRRLGYRLRLDRRPSRLVHHRNRPDRLVRRLSRLDFLLLVLPLNLYLLEIYGYNNQNPFNHAFKEASVVLLTQDGLALYNSVINYAHLKSVQKKSRIRNPAFCCFNFQRL
jgi:hypothetical protein